MHRKQHVTHALEHSIDAQECHSCCGHHHHHHHHNHSKQNPAQKIFDQFTKLSGIQNLVNFLGHNMYASIWALICACIVYIIPLVSQIFSPTPITPLGVGVTERGIGVGVGVLKTLFSLENINTLLVFVSYVLTLPPIMYDTIKSMLALRDVNENTLMCFSAIATIILGCAIEGAFLLALFSLSHSLEHKALQKGNQAQNNLLSSMPTTVQPIKKSNFTEISINLDNLPEKIPLEKVKIDDFLVIFPNSKIPVDGEIVYGESQVVSQYETGESVPQFVTPGKKLISGSINMEALLILKATSTSKNSTMANLSNFIQNAKINKPDVQTILEKATIYWCKIVLICTICAFAVLLVLGVPLYGTKGAVYRCLGVLTAGTPCALAVVPLAYACTVSSLVRKKIIVKGGKILDVLGGADIVALDKTGTLTTGTLKLFQIVNLFENKQLFQQKNENIFDVFQMVKKLTAGSTHPTATAIQNNDEEFINLQQQNLQSQQFFDGNQNIFVNGNSYNGAVQQQQQMINQKERNFQSVLQPVVHQKNQNGKISVNILEQQHNVQFQKQTTDFTQNLSDKNIINGYNLVQNDIFQLQQQNQLQDDKINFINISQFPGKGVEGKFQLQDEKTYFARFGSLYFIQEIIQNLNTNHDFRKFQSKDKISSFLIIYNNEKSNNTEQCSININLLYRFDFEDQILDDSIRAVNQLKTNFPQKQLFILSGDKTKNVEKTSKIFGIPNFFSEFSPFQKTEKIKNWQKNAEKKVVMVGDGINDAAAIAQADVGISLANSIDNIVADSSDILIANESRIKVLPHLFAASFFARKIVLQNLALAFLSIIAGVGPMLFGLIPLSVAVLLHEGTTLLVALNSLRCLMFRKYYQ